MGVSLGLPLPFDCCVITQTVWIEPDCSPRAEADVQGNCLWSLDSALSSGLSQELLIPASGTSSPGSGCLQCLGARWVLRQSQRWL